MTAARTATVRNVLQHPGTGSPIVGRTVSLRLNVPAFANAGATEKTQTRYATTDATGLWSAVLEINDDLDPAGTSYTVREGSGLVWTFQLTAASAGQTVNLRAVLVVDPTNPNPIAARVPPQAAFFNVSAAVDPLQTDLNALLMNFDWAAAHQTPDEYWGGPSGVAPLALTYARIGNRNSILLTPGVTYHLGFDITAQLGSGEENRVMWSYITGDQSSVSAFFSKSYLDGSNVEIEIAGDGTFVALANPGDPAHGDVLLQIRAESGVSPALANPVNVSGYVVLERIG